MKNSIHITRCYQFRYMLLQHLIGVSVTAVFQLIGFWYFMNKPIASKIVSIIFILIYAGYIYSKSRKLADLDRKSYTPLTPNTKFGFLWGVIIGVSIVLSVLLYWLNWRLFAETKNAVLLEGDTEVVRGFNNIISVIINLFMYLWIAPYYGFSYDMAHYDFNKMTLGYPWYIVVIMVIVPITASTLGYIAGKKNFDILSKLDEMTFEKDDYDE